VTKREEENAKKKQSTAINRTKNKVIGLMRKRPKEEEDGNRLSVSKEDPMV
jgi:hypothetical protein